eukprot:CAMPEP_0172329970 /NCGR_PEP_ID=MMETSP1058-20130122/61158_1 /TAXON_ID=83371 /ORGANISM="Detonula confervacea, Strain CCMP 353" /LENGTH=474 /DNA_ID=CAMNT_0013047165 /DNA_START=62 /DNA_END=1483 /DNA_ORIENTATION=+
MFLFVVLLLASNHSADGFGTTPLRWQQPQQWQPQQAPTRRRVSTRHPGKRGLLGAATNNIDARSREQIMSDAIAAAGLTQVKKKHKKTATTTDKKGKSPVSTNANRKKRKINETIKNQAPKQSTSKSKPSSPLSSTKEISLQSQLSYAREGHASLRNLIPSPIIHQIYSDLQAYSHTSSTHRKKGEDSAPFLQFYNTWRDLPSVRALAESPLLCSAACALMGMRSTTSSGGVAAGPSTASSSLPRLRLYQDSVFIKRKNKDGITPWHIDGRMMPFDTSNIITFWIPLHSIPAIEEGGTGLLFISKSHSDFSLPYWNGRGSDGGGSVDIEDSAYNDLTGRYGIENVGDDRIVDNNPGVIGHHMPLNVGDCTVHNGWTMHCANGNMKNMTKKNNSKKKTRNKGDDGQQNDENNNASFQTRYAIAISYVDSHAEVRGDVPGVGKNIVVPSRGGGKKKKGSNNNYKGDAEDRASYAEW